MAGSYKKVVPLHKNYNIREEASLNIVGQQIRMARENADMSRTEFCSELDSRGIRIGPAAVRKWELGQSVPNAYQLVAICDILDIDADLSVFRSDNNGRLNAEGQRRVREYRRDLVASGNYTPAPAVADILDYVDMRVATLAVSAGTGSFLDNEDSFETESFPVSSVPTGADFGVRVSGDSMEPSYHDGQIVWVQLCDELRHGEVGVMFYDGNSYLKVFAEVAPEEDEIDDYTDSSGVIHRKPVMISYNKKYDPIVISRERPFQIVGRVL